MCVEAGVVVVVVMVVVVVVVVMVMVVTVHRSEQPATVDTRQGKGFPPKIQNTA
jgi:cell division protein FtsN